jgi:hypothetical protein
MNLQYPEDHQVIRAIVSEHEKNIERGGCTWIILDITITLSKITEKAKSSDNTEALE